MGRYTPAQRRVLVFIDIAGEDFEEGPSLNQTPVEQAALVSIKGTADDSHAEVSKPIIEDIAMVVLILGKCDLARGEITARQASSARSQGKSGPHAYTAR